MGMRFTDVASPQGREQHISFGNFEIPESIPHKNQRKALCHSDS